MRITPFVLFLALLAACGRARGPTDTVQSGSPSFPKATQDEQAESAVVTAQGAEGNMRIVVGYNDFTSGPENSPKLTYNSTYTTRTVSPGASLAGWSISESNTPNFFIYRGKLAPPAGFSVLW